MNADGPRKVPVVFYGTPSGTEVVRNWLRGLDEGDRNAIGQDLMRVQYRWPVGMPLCRAMGDGLWEVRSGLSGNRIGARVVQRPAGQAPGPSWLHQDEPEHAGRGPGVGPQA